MQSMNQKMQVGGIFCNLANASDFVNNEILLAILNLCHSRSMCKLVLVIFNKQNK